MYKKYISVFLIIIFTTFIFSDEYKIGKSKYKIKIPSEWKLIDEKNVIVTKKTLIMFTRNSLKKDKIDIIPNCFILLEKANTEIPFQILSIMKDMEVVNEMMNQGIKITHSEIQEIIKEKSIRKNIFVYTHEYQRPDLNEKFLRISIYLNSEDDLINIGFDAHVDIYDLLEKEIIYIIDNITL